MSEEWDGKKEYLAGLSKEMAQYMENTVRIPCAQYEAYRAAAEAHRRIVMHDPKTPGLRYPTVTELLASAIGHSEQALAALRAAGIHDTGGEGD